MLKSHDFLPSCKEQAFTDAVIAACADGSGVIENPAACRFNPFRLVGDVTPCSTITAADAAVVEKIWDGPVVDGSISGTGWSRRPRTVVFTDTYPTTATGKVRRIELRALADAALADAAVAAGGRPAGAVPGASRPGPSPGLAGRGRPRG
jgi:acyl-CoA synthetase (AMP-forming)/AMP-acid ligase II